MLRKADVLYAVYLLEDTTPFLTIGGAEEARETEAKNAAFRLDTFLYRLQAALERQEAMPCRILTLILSEDPGRDRALAAGEHAVWLIDPDGKRIVFDNQPARFDQVEKLLESKVYPWSALKMSGNGGWPWATFALVLANVLIQVVVAWQERGGQSSGLLEFLVLDIGGFYRNPQYYRLISSAFLHFGWKHLFNNMLVLLFLGRTAERIAGRGGYLIGYLICAAVSGASSAAWYIWNGEFQVATAGASGAIFGVSGMVLFWVLANHGRVDDISTRQMVWLMAFTIYHGFAEAGVNNCAHITGAIAGFLCGAVIWMIRGKRRPQQRTQESRRQSGGASQ